MKKPLFLCVHSAKTLRSLTTGTVNVFKLFRLSFVGFLVLQVCIGLPISRQIRQLSMSTWILITPLVERVQNNSNRLSLSNVNLCGPPCRPIRILTVPFHSLCRNFRGAREKSDRAVTVESKIIQKCLR